MQVDSACSHFQQQQQHPRKRSLDHGAAPGWGQPPPSPSASSASAATRGGDSSAAAAAGAPSPVCVKRSRGGGFEQQQQQQQPVASMHPLWDYELARAAGSLQPADSSNAQTWASVTVPSEQQDSAAAAVSQHQQQQQQHLQHLQHLQQQLNLQHAAAMARLQQAQHLQEERRRQQALLAHVGGGLQTALVPRTSSAPDLSALLSAQRGESQGDGLGHVLLRSARGSWMVG